MSLATLSAIATTELDEPIGHCAGDLAGQLRLLGVQEGETLLVQSSLRSIGRVDGGAETILKALLSVLGEDGTLVVYTASPENSDTSRMALALTEGLSPAELRAHRAAMAPFDPATTRTSPVLGHFSEVVRAQPGAVRSPHPQTSFTALGRRARELMARHDLDCHLGERSPTQALCDSGARALLIGVPVWCCTAFHLAEYRQDAPPLQRYGCVVTDERGLRQWVHFDATQLVDEYFVPMTEALMDGIPDLVEGKFGDAGCFLLRIAEGVEVADRYLREHWS